MALLELHVFQTRSLSEPPGLRFFQPNCNEEASIFPRGVKELGCRVRRFTHLKIVTVFSAIKPHHETKSLVKMDHLHQAILSESLLATMPCVL